MSLTIKKGRIEWIVDTMKRKAMATALDRDLPVKLSFWWWGVGQNDLRARTSGSRTDGKGHAQYTTKMMVGRSEKKGLPI